MRHLRTLALLPLLLAADEPRKANRLAAETSPYLLQHARNPVDWYPWGPEAFARAKAENKAIFLSIGYSSCYWCHVMERQCFLDATIAKSMNEKFICIKVDREERPDVDAIYMAALQAYSGTGGGWPMSMFLTPDARPFFGGTYFPPAPRDGLPGFPQLLAAVHDAWRDHRPEIEKDADNLADVVRRATDGNRKGRVPLSRNFADAGQGGLAAQFDPEFGGFGHDPERPKRPKFPEPVNLAFLLDRHARRGPSTGPEPLSMVLTTLDHMARGGIRDQLAGGYHRYSTDRSWAVPHFEKMLYDNAQLVSVLMRAYELTNDARWKTEGEATLEFVERSLTAPDGLFYSALDAETDGDEGGYYVWKRAQVKSILGDDSDFFSANYGLDRAPNFEGDRFVLLRPRPAADTPAEVEARLAPMRSKLLAARDRRPAPLRDDKVLTSWNALMIGAYADAFSATKSPRHRAAADRATDALLARHRAPDGRLLRTSRGGPARLAAYLEDYAFLIDALLRLHVSTSDPARLAQARGLADRMLADFADPRGGFFATAAGHEALLARPKDAVDGALPSANGVAAAALVRLAKLTGEPKYLDAAGRALDAFSPLLARSPAAAPTLLSALEAYLDARPDAPRVEVVAATASLADGSKPIAGGEVDLVLTLNIKPGWHLYAADDRSGGTVATVVTLAAGQAATLAKVEMPAGVKKALAGDPEEVAVIEGRVDIKVRVKLGGAVPASIALKVRCQACDDRSCLAPATLDVSVKLADR